MNFVELQKAVLRGVEPEHRIVAQAQIIEADRQHHQGHRRDQLRGRDDPVTQCQNIGALVRREPVERAADRDTRRAARRARRFVVRLHGDADLAHRLGLRGGQRERGGARE